MTVLTQTLCFLFLLGQPSDEMGLSYPLLAPFRTLTPQDGLSQSTVWAISQDTRGFIWLGTDDGLNRYDGYQLTVFKHHPLKEYSLSDNQVRSLCADKQGGIWVGTGRGLCRFRPASADFQRISLKPESSNGSEPYVTSLAMGTSNQIWVGTQSGLYLVDDQDGSLLQKFTPGSTTPAFPDYGIRALYLDPAGILWVGTNQGLVSVDQHGEPRIYGREIAGKALSHPQIRALCGDPSGNLWIATTHGLNRLNFADGSLQIYLPEPQRPDALQDGWINALLTSPTPELWIATKDFGIARFDFESERFQTIKKGDLGGRGLPVNDVVSLALDRSGLIWAGTFNGGVSRTGLPPAKFALFNFPYKQDVRVREVQALLETRDTLWVGTQNGLFSWNAAKQTLTQFQHDPLREESLSENQISCLEATPKGHLIIGTYSGGVNLYHQTENRFERLPTTPQPEQLGNNVIFDILRDRNDRIWIGSRAGLQELLLEERRLRHVEVLDELTIEKRKLGVTDLFQDSQGRLWFGTNGGGVCRLDLDDGSFTRFTSSSANLSNDIVYSVAEDSRGGIWVGTVSGLNGFDPLSQTFRSFGGKHGLPSNTIYSIVPSATGELWLATNKGVARFDLSTDQLKVSRFDFEDGLQSNDFFRGAGLRSTNGHILFGGIEGINGFDPARLRLNETPPLVAITSIEVFDRELVRAPVAAFTDQVSLGHRQNGLAIEFSTLDFHAPSRNTYAFKLDGFDPDWIEVQGLHRANYHNLASGSYVFRVRAANNDGFWSESEGLLNIEIRPPWWKSDWFRWGLAFSLISMGFSYHGWRRWRFQVRNRALESLVLEKTDQLEESRKKLMESAHHAGMFEIANGVLRQIVTLLKEMSAELDHLKSMLHISHFERLTAINRQIEAKVHAGDVRGLRRQMNTLVSYVTNYVGHRQELNDVAKALLEKVSAMKEIISLQHSYAKRPTYNTLVDVREMLEDALKLERGLIQQLGIHVVMDIPEGTWAEVPKIKLMNVFFQIMDNAIHAMSQTPGDRYLKITVQALSTQRLQVLFEDSGEGIPEKMLPHIFDQSITSRAGQHGFGLHRVAIAMKEMAGAIQVHSDGPNQGTRVTLEFPI